MTSLLSYICTCIYHIRAGVLPWLLVHIVCYTVVLLLSVQDKATPVYIAAQTGHVEALSVLISAGADCNAADKVSYSKYFSKQDNSV